MGGVGSPHVPLRRHWWLRRRPVAGWNVGPGGGRLPAAPEAGRHGDRVACDLHHSLFDKEGERGFGDSGSSLDFPRPG